MKQKIRIFMTIEEKNLPFGESSLSKWKKKETTKNKLSLPKLSATAIMLQIAMHSHDAIRTLFAQYTQPKYDDLLTNNKKGINISVKILFITFPIYFSVNTMHKI